jgi:hypothetical protein
MTLNVAVDSHGIHSPLDPQIVVLSHPDGVRQATSEDRPSLDYAVPAGTTAIQVAISDIHHRGGPEFVYRLRVVPANHPDFSLAISADHIAMSGDGSAILRVDVNRSRYDGPIALSVSGAPEITVTPAEIPAGLSKVFVVLSARSGELPRPSVRHLRLIGVSAGLDPPLSRVALAPIDGRLALVPGSRADLTALLTGPSGISFDLGELPPAWFRGADLEIPVTLKIQNAELARYPVRFTLLTTEAARTQPDPADPAKQRQIPVPMLRSVTEQTLTPGETGLRMRVVVPLEVVEGQIDGVVRADFLPHVFAVKALATAYSRPFRLPVQNAVAVQPGAGNLVLTGGAQTKFAGTVKRTARFTAPVDVALVNLPAGYAAPKVTLAPDQEQFEIVVSAPAVTAAADIPNVQYRVSTSSGSLLQRDTAMPTRVMPGQ